jgi:hypothetical protein
MRDLLNERTEVVSRLKELNLEPVSAEEMLPDGKGAWDRLVAEIESCDLFVLLLGDAYGFVPSEGPMAESGKSVTALELDVAKAAGIPVLTFCKRLAPESGPPGEDARRRDAFRAEVDSWDGGLLRAEFDLARDLSESVAQAVVGVIADSFRAAELEQRRRARDIALPAERTSEPVIPAELREAVEARQLTLFFGAGASLSTGMPSAAAFVEAMLQRLQQSVPAYSPPRSGTLFNVLATDFEALLGSDALYKLAGELVDPPYVTESAPAHRIAARLFDQVITTNFDCLLERADGGGEFHVFDSELRDGEAAQPRRLFKIHGSIANPESLVLTEPDLAGLEEQRSRMWTALRELLAEQPVLFVGSSLRDPSLIHLLESCRETLRGWVVMPTSNPSEQIRLRRWNLELLSGDADGVLSDLDES